MPKREVTELPRHSWNHKNGNWSWETIRSGLLAEKAVRLEKWENQQVGIEFYLLSMESAKKHFSFGSSQAETAELSFFSFLHTNLGFKSNKRTKQALTKPRGASFSMFTCWSCHSTSIVAGALSLQPGIHPHVTHRGREKLLGFFLKNLIH